MPLAAVFLYRNVKAVHHWLTRPVFEEWLFTEYYKFLHCLLFLHRCMGNEAIRKC